MSGTTTTEEFARFKAESERLRVLLNLGDYNFNYEYKRIADNDCSGQANVNANGRVATLRLNMKRLDDSTPEDIARHEMAHVLLGTLRMMCDTRYCEMKAIDLEEERICVVLERVLK